MAPRPLLRVALTGGIATGKSSCLRQFASLGAAVVDADVIAREVLARGTPGLTAVVDRFGTAVLAPDGVLDRSALGRIVFQDEAARRDLEAIVHPQVYAAISDWFDREQLRRAEDRDGTRVVGIADIPLLYETGHAADFDKVIVVACPAEEQVRRVMHRDGLSETEARQRLASQLPIDEKRARADEVVDTSGSPEETDRQIREVWERLQSK